MNRALKRHKKKREKETEQRGDDIIFKSVKIKNMANLLEENLNKNNEEDKFEDIKKVETKGEFEEKNKESEKEEKQQEFMQNKPEKVIFKKKITKKKFEE